MDGCGGCKFGIFPCALQPSMLWVKYIPARLIESRNTRPQTGGLTSWQGSIHNFDFMLNRGKSQQWYQTACRRRAAFFCWVLARSEPRSVWESVKYNSGVKTTKDARTVSGCSILSFSSYSLSFFSLRFIMRDRGTSIHHPEKPIQIDCFAYLI